MGSLTVTYNGNTIINTTSDRSFTLPTAGKYMLTNLVFTGSDIPSLSVDYNGKNVLNKSGSGTWTMNTAGKMMESDVSGSVRTKYVSGRDWISVTNVPSIIPQDIIYASDYSSGYFVISGTNAIAYDMYGTNWTKVDLSGIAGGTYYSLAYGNGAFVVCHNSPLILRGVDFYNWGSDRVSDTTLYVAYGNGRFVTTSGSSTKAFYSSDGIIWTAMTLPLTPVGKVKFVGNYFVIPCQNNRIIYSSNGVSWYSSTLSFSANDIAYGGGKYVAVGFNKSGYSTDLNNWTVKDNSYMGGNSIIAYGDGKFVAIANSTAAYSTDGITWNSSYIPGATYTGIAYGRNRFVAVGYSGSTDVISYSYST